MALQQGMTVWQGIEDLDRRVKVLGSWIGLLICVNIALAYGLLVVMILLAIYGGK